MIFLRKMMMIDPKKLALCVIALSFSFALSAQSDFCNTRNTSFKDGEKLTFRVFYNMGFIWINAGNTTFSTNLEEVGGHKVFHIVGEGRTAKSYEWFYKVKDKYETYLDRETLAPNRFIRDVHEGATKIYQDVAFDHKKNIAVSKDKAYPINKCTQDVLSAIYFARNIDYSNYQPGDKIPFSMFLDDKLYNLYIKYMGKEVVTTKSGTFNAIKIAPLLIEGTVFSGGEKMTVWVSDDQNHVPLRVESPIAVGSIKVDLIDFQGLRNPFTSMVGQ